MEQHQSETISALSRPLELGMLYNVCNDKLFPGIRLWKDEDIKSKTHVISKPGTSFLVRESDSLSMKMKLLDVSTSVKANILSGLIDVGCGYLKKKTSSSNQCRVTLKYQVTTEFRELIISELVTPISEVFDMTDATHVVTGVIYGADAFMEFEEIVSDTSKKNEVLENLTVMLKKIPSIDLGVEGCLKMNNEDKRIVKNAVCKFYGDFHLDEIPSTYEEAVKVYKKLPSLLGEKKEKVVPVKVWLYPLNKLTNLESKLTKKISDLLVSDLEEVMDAFHQAEVRTNDLVESSKMIKVDDIVKKLKQFRSNLKDFTSDFLRKIGEMIPTIRKGDVAETALRDLLLSLDICGFSGEKMKKWLDEKEFEISVVKMNINKINCNVRASGHDLKAFLMDPDVRDAFVFSFTSLMYEEQYLKQISQVCECIKSGSTSSIPVQEPREENPWYKSQDVKEAINFSLGVFNKCPNENKVISFISDPKYPGASIRWYRNNVLKDPHIIRRPQRLHLNNDVDGGNMDRQENKKVKTFLKEFHLSKVELNHLRFLLQGPVGAGKSSVINSISSTLQGKPVVDADVSAVCGTFVTQTYKTYRIKDQDKKELPFVISDIMGLVNEEDGGVLTGDIISALKGYVCEGYKFKPLSELTEEDRSYNGRPTLNDQAHCLVNVIPADKISLWRDTDGVIKKMKEVNQAASDLGIPQVVFMTYVDHCCPLVKEDLKHIYSSKKIDEAMQHCIKKLDVPREHIFPMKNYNEENRVDEKMDCLILDALNSTVKMANDYVENLK